MAKVAIIGAGQVGASCAFALAQAGLAREIALADVKEYKARGEANRYTYRRGGAASERAHCGRRL